MATPYTAAPTAAGQWQQPELRSVTPAASGRGGASPPPHMIHNAVLMQQQQRLQSHPRYASAPRMGGPEPSYPMPTATGSNLGASGSNVNLAVTRNRSLTPNRLYHRPTEDLQPVGSGLAAVPSNGGGATPTAGGVSSSGLIRLTLKKPMGIVFEPMYDPNQPSAQRGVRICDLPRTGAAALSRQLQVGDELLQINDKTVSRLTFDEIMDYIIDADPEAVGLLFRRPRKETLQARQGVPQKLKANANKDNPSKIKWVMDNETNKKDEGDNDKKKDSKRKKSKRSKKSRSSKKGSVSEDDEDEDEEEDDVDETAEEETLQSSHYNDNESASQPVQASANSSSRPNRRSNKRRSKKRRNVSSNRSTKSHPYESESFLDLLIDTICSNSNNICRDGFKPNDDYLSDEDDEDDDDFDEDSVDEESTYVTYEESMDPNDTKNKKHNKTTARSNDKHSHHKSSKKKRDGRTSYDDDDDDEEEDQRTQEDEEEEEPETREVARSSSNARRRGGEKAEQHLQQQQQQPQPHRKVGKKSFASQDDEDEEEEEDDRLKNHLPHHLQSHHHHHHHLRHTSPAPSQQQQQPPLSQPQVQQPPATAQQQQQPSNDPQPSAQQAPLGLSPMAEAAAAAQGHVVMEPPATQAADAPGEDETNPNAPIREVEYDERFDHGADVSVMESLGGPSLLIEKQRLAQQQQQQAQAMGKVPPEIWQHYGLDYPAEFGQTREETIQADPLSFYSFVVKSLLEQHEPEKVRLLDKLLAKYKGREDHLVQKLSVRYNRNSNNDNNGDAVNNNNFTEAVQKNKASPTAAAHVHTAHERMAEEAADHNNNFVTSWPEKEEKEDDPYQAAGPHRYAVEVDPDGQPQEMGVEEEEEHGDEEEEDEEEEEEESEEEEEDSVDGTSPAVIAQVSELLNYVYGKTSVPGQIDRVSTIMRAYEGREAVLLELLETKALIKANKEKENANVELPAFLRQSQLVQQQQHPDAPGNTNPSGANPPNGMIHDDISSMSGVSSPANAASGLAHHHQQQQAPHDPSAAFASNLVRSEQERGRLSLSASLDFSHALLFFLCIYRRRTMVSLQPPRWQDPVAIQTRSLPCQPPRITAATSLDPQTLPH